MAITIKRRREVTNPSTARAFNSTKSTGEKEQLFWNKTAALKSAKSSSDGKCASEESVYSSETNSAERLKGRCFIPSGISSYSLLTVSRPFIH